MTLIRRTGLTVLAVSLLACSSDRIGGPSAAFRHASVTRACGPADGPAVAIYFTPTQLESDLASPPYVRVGIDQPLESLGGHGWVVTANSDGMFAVFQPSTGDVEIATSGYLTAKSVNADNSIDGVVDLSFPSGHVQSEFHATFITSTMLCV
jgi:hypothetical protein